ncbi:MAG TPA: M28 family metallopeptidase [Vicinamibacterales bacterium]|nr:M28 family metallopeptidase [Vicinamibacterales bacterium]
MRFLLLIVLLGAACTAPPASTGALALSDLPNISTDAMLADIRKLSSDEFEGRAPGTKGEQLTVQYFTEQFKAAGLEPGNPDGSWTQKVPLVGLTPQAQGPFVVKKGGQTRPFKIRDEIVVFSKHVTDEVRLENSGLVFAGYGVQAPEYQWDDFRGVDVKGKTIIVLVNDPPVTVAGNPNELDPKIFGGKAMTYYGRWTYKFEKAAELGAAGVLVVHETVPAGYPFTVVQGMGGERFDLVTPDKNAGRAKIEGWMSVEAATALLKMAGQDYQKLKAQAATREFKAVPLGATASVAIEQKSRPVDSQNVIAKLTGSDPRLKDEYIVYTAHWDHFGIGEPVNGDNIYNGALDNASGCAQVLEIARAFTKIKPRPKRSLLFLMVTAEEQGLLGSQYYAEFPLYPLAKTVANINIDGINQWGRTKDLTLVGLGASDLDDYAREAAAEQGRVLRPDAEPEKGFYYRSDHFNFAKKGVPALDPDSGIDYIGKPADYGKKKRDEYTSVDYHAPSDEVKPDWDLTGAAEDGKVFLAIGYRVAQAERLPEWKTGNEFKAIRDKMLGR